MRIAIIGSGISGLYAAHLLHSRAELTIFETSSHPGGHSNTVEVAMDGQRLAIDTGFIVFNEQNYPRFTTLLRDLNVAWQPSDMSFSFRCANSGLEYRGDNTFDAIFAQRRNVLRPAFHRMLRDILRFNRLGESLVSEPADTTLGEFLHERQFTGPMVDDYLLPMAGAIWSVEPAQILAFPARQFGRFFQNHGLLQVEGRPQWMTVTGGSREYVRALVRPLRERLLLETPVEWVERHADQVMVKARGRPAAEFDQVVLACHSDQALALLRDPCASEREILGVMRYQGNDAILHTDTRLLPRRRRAWASWNYHRGLGGDNGGVSVTYNLTRLQNLPTRRQFLLTLNSHEAIDPRQIVHRQAYAHPVFDRDSLQAQERHAEINGQRRTWFCGAYWGYGFHEDGARSALRVCEGLEGVAGLPPAPDRAITTGRADDAQLYLSGTR